MHSAVLRLTALVQPRAEVADEVHFRRVVKAGFAQRRKTLLNSLQSDPSLGDAARLREALEASAIDPRIRAEALSLEAFARLSRTLASR